MKTLTLLGNARSDSVIYDLPPQRTGKRGRSALHGRKLSIQDDFNLSDEKMGDYYTAVRHVLTNIFGKRTVMAFVASPEKESGSRCLFFSTIFPEQFQIFCAWQEKSPLNQTGSDWMQLSPCSFTLSDGTLKSAVMSRRHSGRFAVIWSEAAKALECWLI